MTFNIRQPQLPFNSVKLDKSTCSILPGFTHYSPLFNKYPKGLPDTCTQPGGSIGSNCHAEICAGPSHDHTGSSSHHHTVGSGNPSTTAVTEGSGVSLSGSTHKHTTTLCTTSPCVTVCAATYGHIHACQSSEPENQTVKYIQKSFHNMRSSVLPPCKIIWYSKNTCTVPTNYSIDSSLSNNRFYKEVPDASNCTGIQAVSNTHQHIHKP